MITYDSRAGQFRGSNGRFVPRSTILQQINEVENATKTRLEQLSNLLVNNRISLSVWQERTMITIKEANLRTTILASGGKSQTTKSHYGKLGAELKKEWSRLDNFAKEIKSGKLSKAQIVARSKLYTQSSASAFYRSEMLTKSTEGFRYAKRWLDSSARHCNQCPSYSTNGLWLPLDQVILPGHRCDCRGRCKCGISYKK